MVLSQRERYIAIGLGGVLVLVILWQVVYAPLQSWSSQINDDRAKALQVRDGDKMLFADRARLVKVWDDMQKGGLESDTSDAQNTLAQAITDWAVQSGVNVSNKKFNTPVPVNGDAKSGFVQAGLDVTCAGTTSGIAKLLYQIEVARIPVRVHSMQISSRKEGVDDLTVDLKLTTLCVAETRQVVPPPQPSLSSASRTDGQ